ncbi:MAG: response regulator [Myxococcota bacterium]
MAHADRGTRIVFVDDSVVALEWAKEGLGEFGFDVVTYNASLGIQSFVRKNEPHMVLLDVHMPALAGDLVCRMLKDSLETRNVVVALYSSLPERELEELAAQSGADGYIVKTTNVEELADKLRALIDNTH